MKYFFISQTTGTNGIFHPSPAPHFETFQVLLINYMKLKELTEDMCDMFL